MKKSKRKDPFQKELFAALRERKKQGYCVELSDETSETSSETSHSSSENSQKLINQVSDGDPYTSVDPVTSYDNSIDDLLKVKVTDSCLFERNDSEGEVYKKETDFEQKEEIESMSGHDNTLQEDSQEPLLINLSNSIEVTNSFQAMFQPVANNIHIETSGAEVLTASYPFSSLGDSQSRISSLNNSTKKKERKSVRFAIDYDEGKNNDNIVLPKVMSYNDISDAVDNDSYDELVNRETEISNEHTDREIKLTSENDVKPLSDRILNLEFQSKNNDASIKVSSIVDHNKLAFNNDGENRKPEYGKFSIFSNKDFIKSQKDSYLKNSISLEEKELPENETKNNDSLSLKFSEVHPSDKPETKSSSNEDVPVKNALDCNSSSSRAIELETVNELEIPSQNDFTVMEEPHESMSSNQEILPVSEPASKIPSSPGSNNMNDSLSSPKDVETNNFVLGAKQPIKSIEFLNELEESETDIIEEELISPTEEVCHVEKSLSETFTRFPATDSSISVTLAFSNDHEKVVKGSELFNDDSVAPDQPENSIEYLKTYDFSEKQIKNKAAKKFNEKAVKDAKSFVYVSHSSPQIKKGHKIIGTGQNANVKHEITENVAQENCTPVKSKNIPIFRKDTLKQVKQNQEPLLSTMSRKVSTSDRNKTEEDSESSDFKKRHISSANTSRRNLASSERWKSSSLQDLKVLRSPIRQKRSLSPYSQKLYAVTNEKVGQPRSAQDLRNAVFQAWCEVKLQESQSVMKEKLKIQKHEEEDKIKKEIEKTAHAEAAYKSWKNKKQLASMEQKKLKDDNEAKMRREEKEQMEKKNAETAFQSWKKKKDQIIKEKFQKHRAEVKLKETTLREAKLHSREDASAAFKAWKQQKSFQLRCQQEELHRTLNEEKQYKILQEAERNSAALDAFEMWLTYKEHEKRLNNYSSHLYNRLPWCPPGKCD